MGLISHGIAAGIGYCLAQPGARRQLAQLSRQVAELARTPRAKRLRERAWDRAGEHALSARSTVRRLANRTGPTGNNGRAMGGVPSPYPAGRTLPPTPPTR